MPSMFVWSIADLVSVVLILGVGIVLTGYLVFTSVRQRLCKHPQVFENRQCHAICRKCGKDLGFIGSSANEKSRREEN